jgi:DHA2 family multidrug resistance protein
MTMGSLRREEVGNAAGIYNLMRNIGGSIGIATVTTFLVRGSQVHQSYLVANVTNRNPVMTGMLQGLQTELCIRGFDAYTAHQKALGMLYSIPQQQASLLSYADNFRLLGFLSLLCMPLAMFFHRVRKHSSDHPEVIGE